LHCIPPILPLFNPNSITGVEEDYFTLEVRIGVPSPPPPPPPPPSHINRIFRCDTCLYIDMYELYNGMGFVSYRT